MDGRRLGRLEVYRELDKLFKTKFKHLEGCSAHMYCVHKARLLEGNSL